MLYKNYLCRRKENLKVLDKSVPMSLGEEPLELELDPEETKILSEWRTGWWNNKKKRRRIL